MSHRIVDAFNNPIVVGAKVVFHDLSNPPGEVVEIGDPDGDWDDQAQRNVEIPPVLKVRWASGVVERLGTSNDTPVSWADYPDGPAETIYSCDELIVATA